MCDSISFAGRSLFSSMAVGTSSRACSLPGRHAVNLQSFVKSGSNSVISALDWQFGSSVTTDGSFRRKGGNSISSSLSLRKLFFQEERRFSPWILSINTHSSSTFGDSSSEFRLRPRSSSEDSSGKAGSSSSSGSEQQPQNVAKVEAGAGTGDRRGLIVESRPSSSSSSNGVAAENNSSSLPSTLISKEIEAETEVERSILDTAILISPFFLWGTAMVAMKGLLPKAGPMFVASFRLIPAGFLLLGYGALTGKSQPKGGMAWASIALFAFVDATCFQGFLVEGLKRTTAGLGSVIIDSQPLTVAILAALLFGEKLGLASYMGIALGIAGLVLLEVPMDGLQNLVSSLGGGGGGEKLGMDVGSWFTKLGSWESGEWRMLLAAQSMALGTIMVRWVCKYSDPFMATGWHMVFGGLPLLAFSVLQQDPAVSGHIQDLNAQDWSALLYTSVGGSAISYGSFFYNATKGSLTKLSALTFLTPMFAAFFGFLFLSETLSPLQCIGGAVTIAGVLLVNNYKPDSDSSDTAEPADEAK